MKNEFRYLFGESWGGMTMLIKLTSNTSGEMIMFAKHAHRLFEIIGKECTARGVFTAEQLAPAIASLHRAVDEERIAAKRRTEEERYTESKERDRDEDAADETADGQVSLGQRAQPLINLMEWTLKEKGFILWEAERDF
jgi:hypothetical protein